MMSEGSKKTDWKSVLIGIFGTIILSFVFYMGAYKQQIDTVVSDVADVKSKAFNQDIKLEKLIVLTTMMEGLEKRMQYLEYHQETPKHIK